MELIRLTIDPISWDEDPSNRIEYNNGSLIIVQTPKNHRAIRTLLADLRHGTGLQVHIEARFISVENNFLQDIGVDWRGLGDQSGGIGTPGLGTPRAFDDFGAPGANNTLGTDNTSGAYYNFGGGNGDIRGRTQNLYDIGLGNPDVLTAAGGASLQWTFLDDTQLEAILRATQKYERVNTVTAPSLMVSNTQRSNLQLTTQVAYIKDFDVELAQAATIADPIVEVVREGVVLDVRPIVSNDRRFIVLELRPSVATLVRPIRTFSTTLGTGSAVTFETPELRKQSLKTTVVMPDGGTLLLGGLKFYEEQELESKIPILGDIPILDIFFSRKGNYTNMRDLIVLLRAKVVITSEFAPGSR
jgi:type II secretory pathway component GspD/PulD (secretin)